MKTTFSPIISAEKGATCGPFDQGGPVYRTQLTFTLAGLTAHTIEQAQRASFYGIHGNTPAASQAMRATQEAVTAWMDEHATSWTTYCVESAQAMPTTGREGYRATVTVTVDHQAREI